MEKDIEFFITLALPASLLGDNKLTPLERLLLINILSLCKKQGYCWASNEYFCNFFDVTKPTISKSISSLSKYNYIELEYDNHEKNNSKRIIRISEVLKNKLTGIKENYNKGTKENFNQYNKSNYKKNNIINNIYRQDEKGNEYWHGKKIESCEATPEEIKEMENMLKSFKEEGDVEIND